MKKLVLLGLLLVSQSLFAQDVYRLETKFGEQVFGDLLVIDSYGAHSFKGSLTVPGVFTAKAENTDVQDLGSGKQMNFAVQVHESNEDYTVQYNLNISLLGFVTGTLSKDGAVIATIAGTQIYGGK